jgi:ATP-dependent Clp protease ATP-binding subunit ClpC
VFFNSLKKDDISKIVVNEVRMVSERLMHKGFQIKVNPSAIKFLVDEGFDSEFGARPIKRAINRHLEVVLAEKIIDGSFNTDELIKVTHTKDSDKLTFKQ